jgi:hypothetical protein
MFEDIRSWGVRQGDDLPVIYAKRGWWIRPIRWGTSKVDDANIRGRLPATNDPATIAAYRLQIPGCSWSLECGCRSRLVALDIEQRILRGQDGVLELRALAERLGIRESLIPVGLTPIYSTRSGGLRILYAHPGDWVASGVLPGCRWIEVKGDGFSVRLPPGGGYAWDVNSPFALKPMALPSWVTCAKPEPKPRQKLRAEAPLGDRPYTAMGGVIAGRMSAGILDLATSTAEICRRVAGFSWLVEEGRISETYARQTIERLAEEIPDLTDSEFNRGSLARRMLTAFDRRRRHG